MAMNAKHSKLSGTWNTRLGPRFIHVEYVMINLGKTTARIERRDRVAGAYIT